MIASKISAGDEESFCSEKDNNDEGDNKVCLAVKFTDFIYII